MYVGNSCSASVLCTLSDVLLTSIHSGSPNTSVSFFLMEEVQFVKYLAIVRIKLHLQLFSLELPYNTKQIKSKATVLLQPHKMVAKVDYLPVFYVIYLKIQLFCRVGKCDTKALSFW